MLSEGLNARALRRMELSWTKQSDPYSEEFDDIYYAEEGGLQESRYVFLEQNDLSARWNSTLSSFVIGELGFGTGLNFLATWDLWRKKSAGPSTLHYIACEKFPLSASQIKKALDRWPDLHDLRDKFLKVYSDLPRGFHRLRFEEDRVVLTLLIGDAESSLKNLTAQVDAWFFDGFSPKKNPEMWSEPLFRQVARLSKNGSTFSTYTAASNVRAHLEASGFRVEKFKGFGRKREMLKGSIQCSEVLQTTPPKSITIIGAGIAGVSIASAFAKRGCLVTIIDKNNIAEVASANRAAITLPILSAIPNRLSRFSMAGFKFLKNLIHHDPCGILQLSLSKEKEEKWRRALQSAEIPLSCAHFVTPEEASTLAGIQIETPGVFFPEGQLIDLPQFCRNALLIAGKNIQVITKREVFSLQRKKTGWQSLDANGETISESDVLILANAHSISQFKETASLPIRKVRGQIAFLKANIQLQNLKSILCFDGFITPLLSDQTHLIGATYDNNDYSLEVRNQENEDLLEKLLHAVPILKPDLEIVSNWTELRTNVPGMEPLLGEYDQNLFIAAAFSSRGSLYGPISGEILASKIFNEPLPIETDLFESLSPKRFQKITPRHLTH
ncbi:MAG: mnmC [Bacteriovoracaceae bacterium]|nr:mnmC [Bacteriovoracaceae bacterium]